MERTAAQPRPVMTSPRLAAVAVAAAPVALVLGFVMHPFIPRLPDAAAVAAAVSANGTRWAVAHLTVALASGLVILAFLAVRAYLRAAGEDRWSAPALPFIVIGSTLLAFLPGMEFAPLAVARAGGDPEAAQAALQPYLVPVLVLGGLTFAIGIAGFAKAIAASGVLSRRTTWLVVGALAVMAVSRLAPIGVVQFYVQGLAGAVALWPIANHMWQHPQPSRIRGREVATAG